MVHATACSEIIRAEVAELLGVRADALHPGANLVGQGLDSIRMMSLVGRWRRKGIAVDFATLAATPTIEAWSQLVSAGTGVAPTAVAAPGDAGLSQEGEPSLAPMQHAMWVGRHDHQQLGGVAGHLYVEFDGARVDPDRPARRPPGWRCGTRCCGCSSCPTAPSASRRRRDLATFPSVLPTCVTWPRMSSISGWRGSATPNRTSSSTVRYSNLR